MHDARMLGESGLMQDLEQFAFASDGIALCLYGDPAYPLRVHLQQPFRNNAALTEEMRQYNEAMSSVRVSVEWLFGEITKYFKFVDFKQQLKIRLSPIGKIYIVCSILQNRPTNTGRLLSLILTFNWLHLQNCCKQPIYKCS